jgi:cell division protein FtsQ
MTTTDTTERTGSGRRIPTLVRADPETDDAPELDAPHAPEPGDELEVFDDVVDARMRARWIAARRAEGRRRLYVICAVVGTVALVVIAYVIAHSSLLGVDTVEVHGVDAAGAAAVRTAARIPDGEPLLSLDEGAVARRIEALPTVARAEVSTNLPSTVVIRVTTRVPVAWAATGAAGAPVAVVDRDGRVVDRAATPPPGLVQVVGVKVVAEPGAHAASPDAFRALAALPAALRSQVARYEQRPNVGPVLVLGGPTPIVGEIRLGSLDQLRAKATAALAVMDAQRAQDARVAVLGVQVPDAPWTQAAP